MADEIPRQGLLDIFSRVDELIIENTRVNKALLAYLQNGSGSPGSSPGVQNTLLTINNRLDLRDKLETRQLQSYRILTFDMTTAATDREITEPGQSIVAGTDGVLDGCLVRFHNDKNDPSPLKYFDWQMPFNRFYMSWAAQPGKTLYIAVGKEAMGKPQAPTGALFNLIGATERANEHNLAITAATPFLTSGLTPLSASTVFRIQVAVDTAGLFQAVITKASNAQTINFNAGNNLAAGSLYVFDMLVHAGDSVNFQHSINATLQVFRVQEVAGA